MSNTCSIVNRQTNEPKLFYKSDNGGIYTSLSDVLNNSNSFYETGFKNNNGNFLGKATTPIFDKSTKEGKIQDFIKKGFLSGKQVGENRFEATDSLSAEILYQDLLINDYFSFKKEGNDFIFDDYTISIYNKSS